MINFGTRDEYNKIKNGKKIYLKDIHLFIKDFYGEDNYFSCTRETMANRSIEHFHMHFLPGKLQGSFLRKMLMGRGFPVEEE